MLDVILFIGHDCLGIKSKQKVLLSLFLAAFIAVCLALPGGVWAQTSSEAASYWTGLPSLSFHESDNIQIDMALSSTEQAVWLAASTCMGTSPKTTLYVYRNDQWQVVSEVSDCGKPLLKIAYDGAPYLLLSMEEGGSVIQSYEPSEDQWKVLYAVRTPNVVVSDFEFGPTASGLTVSYQLKDPDGPIWEQKLAVLAGDKWTFQKIGSGNYAENIDLTALGGDVAYGFTVTGEVAGMRVMGVAVGSVNQGVLGVGLNDKPMYSGEVAIASDVSGENLYLAYRGEDNDVPTVDVKKMQSGGAFETVATLDTADTWARIELLVDPVTGGLVLFAPRCFSKGCASEQDIRWYMHTLAPGDTVWERRGTSFATGDPQNLSADYLGGQLYYASHKWTNQGQVEGVADLALTRIIDLSDQPVNWIDAHMHCTYEGMDEDQVAACLEDISNCCVNQLSGAAQDKYGRGISVILSLEDVAVSWKIDGPDDIITPETDARWWYWHNQNEAINAHKATGADPDTWLFANVDCWHDKAYDGLENGDWIAACMDDVDRLIDEGAMGFKDRVGKQMADKDGARWLGVWNRKNGFCDATGAEVPHLECMTEPQVVYPSKEPAYRALLKYIV